MHFGIITPPVPGHLHPFGALGRELIERGHRVTVFHIPDLRARAENEGLEYVEIGQQTYPHGSLEKILSTLTQLHGFAALRFTMEAIRGTTEVICRDAPEAIGRTNVDALLVDQTEPAGAAVAEHLRLPYVTVCNALLLNREAGIPPPFSAWHYHPGLPVRLRNLLGYWASDYITRSVPQTVARYRKKWGLPPYRRPEDSFSSLLQISQQTPAFDFPRRELPATFRYVGPLRKPPLQNTTFPWDKLDGRPLVYASLGTLQNGKEHVFRCFAEACRGLDVQLVMTHGGRLSQAMADSMPGKPLVVSYAPQLDVLSRADLTLTHAGLNTVLDSLTYGVPLVAVPLTYEQPAIASRISWTGTGKILPFSRLNQHVLRCYLRHVLKEPSFASAAKAVQQSIANAGGVTRAANLIEQSLGIITMNKEAAACLYHSAPKSWSFAMERSQTALMQESRSREHTTRLRSA